MRYTPVELRHVRSGRALFGYKRDETERMLDDVADSFEEVWRERGELTDSSRSSRSSSRSSSSARSCSRPP